MGNACTVFSQPACSMHSGWSPADPDTPPPCVVVLCFRGGLFTGPKAGVVEEDYYLAEYTPEERAQVSQGAGKATLDPPSACPCQLSAVCMCLLQTAVGLLFSKPASLSQQLTNLQCCGKHHRGHPPIAQIALRVCRLLTDQWSSSCLSSTTPFAGSAHGLPQVCIREPVAARQALP